MGRSGVLTTLGQHCAGQAQPSCSENSFVGHRYERLALHEDLVHPSHHCLQRRHVISQPSLSEALQLAWNPMKASMIAVPPFGCFLEWREWRHEREREGWIGGGSGEEKGGGFSLFGLVILLEIKTRTLIPELLHQE